VLAPKVNPELRERRWDTLPDDLRFWYIVLVGDRPLTNRAALIRNVVGDVCALYRDPMEVET
jgi:hypothetical protein